MSEEELHVPHAHHGGSSPLEQGVAIFTALLAALGAVVSFRGNHLMDEALLKKNEAVLHKAEATDAWNHYQATSTKLHLAELAQQLVSAERAASFAEKITKYTGERDALMAKARALDQEAGAVDREAAALGAPHSRLAMAMIFLQIAISIASITALTRRGWLFAVALASAGVGAALCVAAFLAGG